MCDINVRYSLLYLQTTDLIDSPAVDDLGERMFQSR